MSKEEVKIYEKIYAFATPYASANLLVIYNKNFDILEGNLREVSAKSIGYCVQTFTATNRHYQTKGGKDKTVICSKKLCFSTNYKKTALQVNVVGSTSNVQENQPLFFTDFETALASKCMLLKDLKKQVDNQLEIHRKRLEKQFPDLNHILSPIQKNRPELFI